MARDSMKCNQVREFKAHIIGLWPAESEMRMILQRNNKDSQSYDASISTYIRTLRNISMYDIAQPTSNETITKAYQHTRSYLLESIRVDFLIELQLLVLTFSIGIQDAISFPDFHCFASNQTGNSVVLAVGLAGIGGDLFDIRCVAISLSMFISGATITGQIAHVVGTHRRAWLILSHLMQTIMIFCAATIQASYPSDMFSTTWGAIALLAFSSGAQVASMRPMRIPEITTAMATAAWVDLVVDPKLLAVINRSRNRRASFLVILVAGSFAGAFMHVTIGSANALIVSGAGKLLVTLTLFFNRANVPNEQEVV